MTSVTTDGRIFSELELADVPGRVVHEASALSSIRWLAAGADGEIRPVARGAARLFGSAVADPRARRAAPSLLAGVYANGRSPCSISADLPGRRPFDVGAVPAALGMAPTTRQLRIP